MSMSRLALQHQFFSIEVVVACEKFGLQAATMQLPSGVNSGSARRRTNPRDLFSATRVDLEAQCSASLVSRSLELYAESGWPLRLPVGGALLRAIVFGPMSPELTYLPGSHQIDMPRLPIPSSCLHRSPFLITLPSS